MSETSSPNDKQYCCRGVPRMALVGALVVTHEYCADKVLYKSHDNIIVDLVGESVDG